jgi:hypothetical protein
VVVVWIDNRCEGGLKAGRLLLVDDREQVECSACGKLLEPGYARLVPAHEPDTSKTTAKA